MTDLSRPLPWEELRRTEGDLPWAALETFAEAVVSDRDVARQLFAEYEKAWQAVDVPTYMDLYVPAIFTLAAPRLSDEQRREIGSWLVDKLIEAGYEEADLAEEALLSAAGAMGPVILPKLLDTLEGMPPDDGDDSSEAWSQCWSLTTLATKTDDAAVRTRTIQACLRLLEQIEQGKYDGFLGISAAWTLALLKYADAAPLLQRLSETIDSLSGGADYAEALKFLQGRSKHVYKEAWEWPVREWLESSWQTAKDWYAKKGSADSEEEQEAAAVKRDCELRDRFMASPQAAQLAEVPPEDKAYIAQLLLEYARVYEGAAPEELTTQTLQALLFDAFPRKVTAERDFFERLPVVVEAFLRWLAAEGILPEGETLADTVRSWAGEIVAEAMAPENWGLAKQFTMKAQRAGVDMTDQDALHRYMYEQAQEALAQIPYKLPDETPITPPIPIVEHAPKVGRNDPCPCGSGKKYKKCCGAPGKSQTTSV
jgi:hypothetical protein